MNHLLDLDEEFDLTDAAAPALEVVSRPEARALREMVADPGRNLPNFVDDTEIERTAPNERPDGAQKPFAEPDVPPARPSPNEGRPLPRQRARLIMGNGSID